MARSPAGKDPGRQGSPAGRRPAGGLAAHALIESSRLTLRVSEALPKDVGRGMARLDPDSMERLGIGIGDVVTITGRSTTALKAMPVYPDERGKELIQIDGIARENAGTGLDERVRVEPTVVKDAVTVVLSPIGKSWLSQQAGTLPTSGAWSMASSSMPANASASTSSAHGLRISPSTARSPAASS